jgi:biopolymer transport protein ExbB
MELMTYIDRGGIIVYILIGLNIIGFSIIVWKFVVLLIARSKQNDIVENILDFTKENNEEFNIKSLDNILTKEMTKLELGLNTIQIIATISPLLGLLGTVIGVLHSFDSISKLGLGDPSIFSAGISIALITTVAGMIVAIPHFIAYNYFAGILEKIENNLESQVLKRL